MPAEELPTVLTQAMNTLGLPTINVTPKDVNAAFKNRTTGYPSLETLSATSKAKRLLSKFLKEGTFNFACANCQYLTKWNINLYIEIEGILLCPTCQRGLENILENNPSFKSQAQLNKEAAAKAKHEELESAWRKRMESK